MSTLTVGTIQSNTTLPPVVENSAGTQIGTFCRAWVNFNGIGTVSIRAAFNVSSITDNAAGDYTVNFATAMSDVNYCPEITSLKNATLTNVGDSLTLYSLSSLRFYHYEAGAAADTTFLNVAVFR